jgi:hypothetical protein
MTGLDIFFDRDKEAFMDFGEINFYFREIEYG